MDNDFPGNMSRACATAYFHQFSLTWEGRRRVNLLMNFKKYRAPWECSTGSFIIILLFHRIIPCTDGFVYSGILTRFGWGRKKKKTKRNNGFTRSGHGCVCWDPISHSDRAIDWNRSCIGQVFQYHLSFFLLFIFRRKDFGGMFVATVLRPKW